MATRTPPAQHVAGLLQGASEHALQDVDRAGTHVEHLLVVLYNPRIVASSDDTDEQHEGCLSFFDVRGMVERPLRIDVEHQTVAGELRMITFERAAARLWAHEIDHLSGTLYVDRLPEGYELVPSERYTGTGEAWRY